MLRIRSSQLTTLIAILVHFDYLNILLPLDCIWQIDIEVFYFVGVTYLGDPKRLLLRLSHWICNDESLTYQLTLN